MLKNSTNTTMSPEIVQKLATILERYPQYFESNFKLTFSRYNEPLLNPKLHTNYFSILKRYQPYFTVNTNGDFLNTETKTILNYANLFIINDYDGLTEEQALIKLLDWLNDPNILAKYETVPNQNLIRLFYENTTIEFYYNKPAVMHFRDRGGSLQLPFQEENRTTCNLIGTILAIDVDGSVYPCCDTCGLIPNHHQICCGNLLHDDFKIIYNNLINTKPIPSICKHCTTEVETIFDNNSR